MILATLYDQYDQMIGRLEASEKGETLTLSLRIDAQFQQQWNNVLDALGGFTLKLGLDGIVVAYKMEAGARIQRNLSALVADLSRGNLHFQWEKNNIEAAHDLETKLRKAKTSRPAIPGDLIELVRHPSVQS